MSVIAVYADVNSYHQGDAYEYFIKNLLVHLAKLYPQDEFYFIHHNTIDELGQIQNLDLVYLPVKKDIASRYFTNRKLASVLRKIKAERIFSVGKIIKSNIPQSVLISRINKEKKIKRNAFEKLNAVFTLSQSLKKQLVDNYGISPDKITVVYGDAALKEPVSDETKNQIKEKYTEGREFFLFRGRIANDQNIITLLKAFSLFKKRQKSSMKLVLMGKTNEHGNELTKLLSTYRFRSDVVLISEDEKLLSAAAFALVQPYSSNSLLFAFDALQDGIPVLLNKNSPFAEIAADAALFFDHSEVDGIADKLMLIYKDENLYQRLKQKGSEAATALSWEQTVQALRQSMQ